VGEQTLSHATLHCPNSLDGGSVTGSASRFVDPANEEC
jgi:hypothetical protein